MEIYAIDTKEKLNWFLNALENEEIIIDSREMTEEDHEVVRRKMSELRAKRKAKAKELVLA